MKLTFLKIDHIRECDCVKTIEIPGGGIQFEHKNHEIISVDPVSFQMTDYGNFENIMQDVQFEVYEPFNIKPNGDIKTYSLFSIIAHEDVQKAIYKKIVGVCKSVPLKFNKNESELFAMEYEYKYKKLLGELK